MSLQIAKRIKEDYSQFRSFVIFSPYEDMEYISTGISLMCKNLRKLVIFTGGQEDINRPNSDSATNLSTSLLIANNFIIPEVTIFHHNKLLRANRVIRTNCQGTELFKSPNYPPLATTINQDITGNWENILDRNTSIVHNCQLELDEVVSQ